MIEPDDVIVEIVGLHEFFESWLNGDDATDFSRVERALADDFTFLPPNGQTVSRDELLTGLREGFGRRPIQLRIERPAIRWHDDSAWLATYEEWHEHADYTTARRSSVLLTADDSAPGGLLWRLVHETWLRPPPA